jgi:hypothetical protein
MTEELIFERILKDRTRYTKYYLSHDSKSFFLTVRYTTGNYLEYEIHATITINANTVTPEILDKIEKESVRLFKESYDFLNYRKTYKLIAIILLLLIKYKIVKLIHLSNSSIVKISYKVVTGKNFERTYDLKSGDFLNLAKKLDKFFKENKIEVAE